jgi:2-polyprenyl-6-hydroxyphenyl methylase/3-demethylubiquinone-9 3-methyltransferase
MVASQANHPPDSPPNSVDPAEIAHFARDSARWWDPAGPHAPLHRLNPIRLGWLRDQVAQQFGRDPRSLTPLEGLTALDVGCGGGLVAEPLARMGAVTVGLDADAVAIEAARAHAADQALSLTYRVGSVEAEPADRYDLVAALEVVEHVADLPGFVESCARTVKPGGLVLFSTLNRTAKSFALGVVAAERVLRWVPAGTHDWRKFVKPAELARACRAAGLEVLATTGLVFDPLAGGFRLSERDLSVNYFLAAQRAAPNFQR